MDKIAISIIVPVHDAGAMFTECAASILSQSFRDIELLVVDDGSMPQTACLCDDIAVSDERVHVFHRKGSGVSAARNFGLSKARGEWVLFVDADDRLAASALETLIGALVAAGADMAFYRYRRIDEDGAPLGEGAAFCSGRVVVDAQEALRLLLDGAPEEMPWGFIAKRSLYEGVDGFSEAKVRFPEDVRFMEDAATTWKVVCAASRVLLLPDCLYEYRRSGAAKTARANPQDAWDVLKVLSSSFYIGVFSAYPDLRDAYLRHRAEACVIGMDRAVRSGDPSDASARACRELKREMLSTVRDLGWGRLGGRLRLKVLLVLLGMWPLIVHGKNGADHIRRLLND